MTKYEFLTSLPYFIDHPVHGRGELEAYTTNDGFCAAQYRHANGLTSYGGGKRSWKELYADLRAFLRERGHCE